MLKKIDVIKDFDLRSGNYGSWFNKSMGTKYIDRLEKQTLFELVKSNKKFDKKTLVAAEIGPGNGRIAGFLTKKIKFKNYYGVEISPLMIEALKKKFIPGLNSIFADGTNFKLPQKVDVIISIRQIKYNHDYKKQLKSMSQALKSDGVIIIEFASLFSTSFLGQILPDRASELINPFAIKATLRKLKFNKLQFIPLRYLPDAFFIYANSRKLAELCKSLEQFLVKKLPWWMAKSVIIVASKY